jgi:3-deoxy-D-manno-octulosonic-acid transferase
VTGNMKYDLTGDEGSEADARALRHALGFAETDVVIIGGSLHPGEDLDLLSAYTATRKDGAPTRLIIVPRYPEQAAQVMVNAVESGCRAILKSELDRNPGAARDNDLVVVVDTLGVLRRLYAAADIAFVGGSLYYRGANKGGHNLMEPAILGLPVIFGPHNFSFRETVADLLAHDAGIEVHDRRELTRAIAALVDSEEQRSETGRRARQVVLEGQGAALRNLELILPILNNGAGCSRNPEDAQCRHQARSHLLNE